MQHINETRRNFLKGGAALAATATAMAAGVTIPMTAMAGESSAPEQYVEGYYTQVNWLGAKPEVAEDQIVATYDYDVVVVGCGHAGAQVALAAAEDGAKVAVVEKQREEEFNENGSEFGAFNSSYVMEHYGIEAADLGEVVDAFVKANYGLVNPTIIRKYVENSGATMDHMIECIQAGQYADILDDEKAFLHVGMNEDFTQKLTGYPIVESGTKSWAGTLMFKTPQGTTPEENGGRRHNGLLVLKSVIDASVAAGAEFFWAHSAVVLDQNEAGDVTGIIAKNADGAYVRINAAKGVAVCTGDYSFDTAMVASLQPELVEWNLRNGMSWDEAVKNLMGTSGRDGYGHKMCCWAGGYIEEAPRATQQAGTASNGVADIPTGPFGAASFLELNCRGERFFNESDYYSARGATARQPKGTIAFVTDTQYWKNACRSGLHHGGPNFGRQCFIDQMIADWDAAAAGESGEYQVQCCSIGFAGKSTIFRADTLEELAGFLGYEGEAAETFVASVERYNEMCEAGVDTDFGKDPNHLVAVNEPPYFGWVGVNTGATQLGLVTLSGMVTDNDFNVLDGAGQPIRGLYVAGNTLGGRYAIAYSTPVAGNSLGMAITHGRLLGKQLAAL